MLYFFGILALLLVVNTLLFLFSRNHEDSSDPRVSSAKK
ncbi:hypothetical protein GGR31_002289 [Mesonia maritima]|uniref:Photosystem II reaction center protein I n=1 Tax=Mesonia maritima TaxID=1793873 RepID=A0ABU1K7N0_9FLAO|nr:hypothetical protein [Mesonia maritima]